MLLFLELQMYSFFLYLHAIDLLIYTNLLLLVF